MKVNLNFGNFIVLAGTAFFLLIFSSLVLASVPVTLTDKNSVLLAELSPGSWRQCAKQNENLVEAFYIETANFFANICQKQNKTLIYIGGEKANAENAIQMPAMAEEGTGYVAENEEITYIVTGATFSLVKNGKTISEEPVKYICSQLYKKICQER